MQPCRCEVDARSEPTPCGLPPCSVDRSSSPGALILRRLPKSGTRLRVYPRTGGQAGRLHHNAGSRYALKARHRSPTLPARSSCRLRSPGPHSNRRVKSDDRSMVRRCQLIETSIPWAKSPSQSSHNQQQMVGRAKRVPPYKTLTRKSSGDKALSCAPLSPSHSSGASGRKGCSWGCRPSARRPISSRPETAANRGRRPTRVRRRSAFRRRPHSG
jgi:hypothetical protein